MSVAAFDDTPSLTGIGLTTLAAVVAAGATVLTGFVPAVLLASVGLLTMPIGVARGSRRIHTLGAAATFGGVLAAGAAGAAPLSVLVATGATVVAWDAGENAIGVGRQLGARAPTQTIQAVHTGATAAVAVLVGGLGYGVYRTASGGQPTTAVLLLLLAALLFTWLLDNSGA